MTGAHDLDEPVQVQDDAEGQDQDFHRNSPQGNPACLYGLVGEIARQNGLKLDFNRVKETLSMIASTYEEPKQVIELYRNDPNLMSGLQNRVLEEQVIDWVAERAQATDLNLSFTEAMRPV